MVFAIVRFGRDEQILINPECIVINLLDDLKRRSNQRLTTVLDLTDETGLVVDLDAHKYDYADTYLKTHERYVLVEKQVPEDDLLASEFGSSAADLARSPSPALSVRSVRSQPAEKAKYTVLLENVQELLPDYRLRHANETSKKKGQMSRPLSRAGEDETSSARTKSRHGRSMKAVAHAISAKRRLKGSAQS